MRDGAGGERQTTPHHPRLPPQLKSFTTRWIRNLGPPCNTYPSMGLSPFVRATAAPAPETFYHSVPVPTTATVADAFGLAAGFEHAVGAVDATIFVDICLRFACLAYRRNAGRTSCTAARPATL